MSKRILIFGGDGMLGHQLLKSFQSNYHVTTTLRNSINSYKSFELFNHENSIFDIDVGNFKDINEVFVNVKPEVVINCVGIVKQRSESKDAIESIKINSLFPHQLELLCGQYDARLIQISTDCVFSGKKGGYLEEDIPDAEDIYGRTKLLGEVFSENAITLRTSIIGLELSRKQGLVEWFLAQRGTVKGYSKAIFSGFTTIELASIIDTIIIKHPGLTGLWHVSSNPINKYQLLNDLAVKLDREDIEILEDKEFICDRSLNGSRFNSSTGYSPRSWDNMLDELAKQILNYD